MRSQSLESPYVFLVYLCKIFSKIHTWKENGWGEGYTDTFILLANGKVFPKTFVLQLLVHENFYCFILNYY